MKSKIELSTRRGFLSKGIGLAMASGVGVATIPGQVVQPSGNESDSPRNLLRSAAKRLAKAAHDARVGIESEHVALAGDDHAGVLAAPVRGIESVPARQLPGGVDFAFASLWMSHDMRGNILLRAFATPAAIEEALVATRAGEVPPEGNASVQLIGAANEIVTEVPAHLQQVFSLDVPPDADRANNFVDASKEGIVVPPNPSLIRISIRIWVQCSNGWRICVEIRF